MDCCSCGHTEYETLPLLNHTHNWNGVYSIDDTHHWKVCETFGCVGIYEVESLEAHVYDQEVVNNKYFANEATCLKAAQYFKSCICGHFDPEESGLFESGDKNKDNHATEEVKYAVNAEDSEKHDVIHVCCGQVKETVAHNEKTAATCQVLAVCADCNASYGKKAEHAPNSAWESDGTYHWHECTSDVTCTEKLNYEKCSGGTATHKEKATCSTCSKKHGQMFITIAEAIELSGTTKNKYTAEEYYIEGVVTSITDTYYGNIYIEDETGSLYIYGVYIEGTKYGSYSGEKFVVGDTVALKGVLGYYNSAQMKNADLVSYASNVSIEKAIELAGTTHNVYTEEKYTIEGQVTEIKSSKYGNIYISDGTNSIYVYGIYVNNDSYGDYTGKKFAVGDTVTLRGILGCYNSAQQMKNADLISWQPAPEQVTVEKAIELAGTTQNAYTTEKYIVTGKVTQIKDSTFGNIYIEDETGSLYVYGVNINGLKYGDYTGEKFAVGDTVTLCGVLGYYYSPQMKSADLISWEKAEEEVVNEEKTIAEFVASNDTNTTYSLQGVVTAINAVDAAGSFVLTDSTGSIFCYTSLNVKLGDEIKINGNLTYNYSFPQLGNPVIVGDVISSGNDVSAASGTSTKITAESVATNVSNMTNGELISEYAGKYLEITGYVLQSDKYYGLAATASDTSYVVNLYLNSSIDLSAAVGQKVVLYGFARGVYAGKNISVQVQSYKLETEGETPDPEEPETPTTGVVATFDFGENGEAKHEDGDSLGTSKTYEDGDYTLELTELSLVYGEAFDEKGNSCIKLGTSNSPASLTFVLPNDVLEVIVYVAGYKQAAGSISINGGSALEISTLSYNGEYTAVRINTKDIKVLNISTTSSVFRAMINKIEYSTTDVSGDANAISPDKIVLKTPSVTVSSDGEASWPAINNATGYTYKINDGNEETTTDTCVKLSVGDSIIVKALGDEKNFSDSAYSESADYSEEEPTEAIVVIGDYATAHGWSNSTKYNTIEMDSYTTVTATGGSNTGKYYTSGTNWRIYQNESPTVTITSTKVISKVKITYSINNTGVLTLEGQNISSGTEVEVNGNTVTFSVGNTGTKTNGQVRITKIEVYYVE